jgi:hypothetical protein
MEAFVLDPGDPIAVAAAPGAIVCDEVSVAGVRLFRKGHVLVEADLAALATVDRPLHAVRLAADDVHEDVAGMRLAQAVAGAGIELSGPIQSRVNLRATERGLLRVDSTRLAAMNSLFGVAVFTLLDRIPVLPGKIVAGAKITPVALPDATIAAAERLAADGDRVVRIAPFRALRVGVVTTEGLKATLQERFQATVRKKVAWYGGEVIGFADLPADPAAVAGAIAGFQAQGAELILAGGGNTIDPLDATLQALPRVGAELVAFGAAAHPGSMFWLAQAGALPIVNLASCSMYSKATVADLVLPWIFAGERVTAADMAALGHGGLLDRDMAFRFPDYERSGVTDEE